MRRRPKPEDLVSAADFTALSSQLHGSLVLPGQSAYGQAKLGFNPLFDTNNPAAVAQVASAQDVQACISFARQKQLVDRGAERRSQLRAATRRRTKASSSISASSTRSP